MGGDGVADSDGDEQTEKILVLSNGPLRRINRLAPKINIRMAEKTSTLTCQVEPNNKDISVTLLVYSNRKLAPNRNKVQSGFLMFFLPAAKMIKTTEIKNIKPPA